VLAAEELQQPVLRVVRVLVLVDEDVAEGLAPVGERLGEALNTCTVSMRMSSKSTAFEACRRRWYSSYVSATV
jgi:hypothetical protein